MAAPPTTAVCVVSPQGVSRGLVPTVRSRLEEEGFQVQAERVLLLGALPAADRRAVPAVDRMAAEDPQAGPAAALLLALPAGAEAGDEATQVLAALLHELEHTYASASPWEALRDRLALFPAVSPLLERTVAVLKPGLGPEALEQAAGQLLAETGLVLLARAEVSLDAERAKAVAADPDNEEEVDYLSGDEPCTVLLLEGRGAVDRLLLAAGPPAPAQAREAAPSCVRARFGIDAVQNALHASAGAAQARAEAAALLPGPLASQRLLVLAPVAAAARAAAALDAAGFRTVARRPAQLSEGAAESLGLGGQVAAGAVEAFCVEKPAAAATWQAVAAAGAGEGVGVSAEERHLKTFFPQMAAAVLPGPDDVRSMLLSDANGGLNSVLVGGLTHLCRSKPVGLAAVRELARWLHEHNPNRPRVVVPDDAEGEESEDERVEGEPLIKHVEDVEESEAEEEEEEEEAAAVEEEAAAPEAKAEAEQPQQEEAAAGEQAGEGAAEPAAAAAPEGAEAEPVAAAAAEADPASEPVAAEPEAEEAAAVVPEGAEPAEKADTAPEAAAESAPAAEEGAEPAKEAPAVAEEGAEPAEAAPVKEAPVAAEDAETPAPAAEASA